MFHDRHQQLLKQGVKAWNAWRAELRGGTPRQITTGKFSHKGFDWAADSKTIFIAGLRKPDAEYCATTARSTRLTSTV